MRTHIAAKPDGAEGGTPKAKRPRLLAGDIEYEDL